MLLPGLTSLLAAALVGAALLALIYFALRHSVGTIILLLGVWVASIALRDSVDLAFTVVDVRILALDVLSAILALVGVGRVLFHGVRGLAPGLAVALLVLAGVHALRGIVEIDGQTALNSARPWLYFTAPLVYAATVPHGWDVRAWKVLIAAGVVLVAASAWFFLREGIGTSYGVIYRDGQSISTRPLVADGALLILQAAILAAALRWPSRRAAVYVALGAAAAVLLLQHRTIWVAGLVVAVASFISWVSLRGRQAESTVLLTSGIVLLLLPVAIWGFAQTDSLAASASEATSGTSTFTWRTEGWSGLLASHDSASQLAVGDPSGADQRRLIGGRTVDVSAHNGFIDAYIRFGLPGALILLWLGLLLWFRRRTVAAGTGLSPQVVGLLLITQLAFSIAYSLGAVQGLIAGILISGVATTSAVRAPVVTRPPALSAPAIR